MPASSGALKANVVFAVDRSQASADNGGGGTKPSDSVAFILPGGRFRQSSRGSSSRSSIASTGERPSGALPKDQPPSTINNTAIFDSGSALHPKKSSPSDSRRPSSATTRSNSLAPTTLQDSAWGESGAPGARNGNNWLGEEPETTSVAVDQFLKQFKDARQHRERTDFEISRLKEQAAGLKGIMEVLDPPERQIRKAHERGGSTLKDEFNIKHFTKELSPFATKKVNLVGEDVEIERDDSMDGLLDDDSYENSSAAPSPHGSSSYASSSAGGSSTGHGKSAILKDKQARDRERFEKDPTIQFEFAMRHMQQSGCKTRVQRTLAHYYFMQKDSRKLRKKMKQMEREAAMDQSKVPLAKRPMSAPLARPSTTHRQCFPMRPTSAMPGRHAVMKKIGGSAAVHGGDGEDSDSDASSEDEMDHTQKLRENAKAALFGPSKVQIKPQCKSDYKRLLQEQNASLTDLHTTDKEYRGMVDGLQRNTERLHRVLENVVNGMDHQVASGSADQTPTRGQRW